jgi:uncharacterized membrane protein YtjA (UPF0391 family)
MLHYAVVFFVIALIAALFGFGGIAAGAAGIAKILFVVFIILAVATFLFGRNRGAYQRTLHRGLACASRRGLLPSAPGCDQPGGDSPSAARDATAAAGARSFAPLMKNMNTSRAGPGAPDASTRASPAASPPAHHCRARSAQAAIAGAE